MEAIAFSRGMFEAVHFGVSGTGAYADFGRHSSFKHVSFPRPPASCDDNGGSRAMGLGCNGGVDLSA